MNVHTYTQDDFKRALSHLLYEGKEYDVTIVSVTPYDSLILFEFYAEHPNSKTKMNTTNAYYKLTEKGQNFMFLDFHIVKVDMKGELMLLFVCTCYISMQWYIYITSLKCCSLISTQSLLAVVLHF